MATPESMMTPHEYLEHLQSKQFGGEVPPYTRDIGDVLTANLIAGLPDGQRAQLQDIAIGVLPTTDINAYVSTVPAGGKVIGFNYGLLSFTLALNKIMLSRTSLLGFEPSLEFDRAFELARDVSTSFGGDSEPPRLGVSPTKMIVASSLSNVQTSFVVGHELGHSLLGHLDDLGASADDCHRMEFDADGRGAELLLADHAKGFDPLFGNPERKVVLAGIDIFFTYLHFLNRLRGLPESSRTHPSPLDRRKRLRDRFASQTPPEAKALAEFAESLFESFAHRL